MRFTKQKLFLTACLFSALFSFSIIPQISQARGLVPCGGYNADGTHEKPCNVEDSFILIARVTNYLISAAGIYAMFKIIQAGFGMTYSAGQEETITQLKGQITNAIVGFVIVLIAFITVNTVINVILGPGLISSYYNPGEKCKIDLTSPLNYLNVTLNPNYFDASKCTNLVTK